MTDAPKPRQCDGCTLCCTLLPVQSLGKKAQRKCKHQTDTGCGIYDKRPMDCFLWVCGWLKGAPVEKPSDSGYVIDVCPDYIGVDMNDGQPPTRVPVLQVWIDPDRPDAHRDIKLRSFIDQVRTPAIIRQGKKGEGFLLVPPSLSNGGDWQELSSNVTIEEEHSAADIADVWRENGKEIKL